MHFYLPIGIAKYLGMPTVILDYRGAGLVQAYDGFYIVTEHDNK